MFPIGNTIVKTVNSCLDLFILHLWKTDAKNYTNMEFHTQ